LPSWRTASGREPGRQLAGAAGDDREQAAAAVRHRHVVGAGREGAVRAGDGHHARDDPALAAVVDLGDGAGEADADLVGRRQAVGAAAAGLGDVQRVAGDLQAAWVVEAVGDHGDGVAGGIRRLRLRRPEPGGQPLGL